MDAISVKAITVWLWSNSPELVAGIVLGAIYVRVGKVLTIQSTNTRRIHKLMRLHAEHHPEDGAVLFDDSRDHEAPTS
jgi:hypothetical protein